MTVRDRFHVLHHEGCFVMPNPWDAGSARLLVALGAPALATTSSGHAASLGREDGGVGRAELVAHVRALTAAVDVPVSVDAERCFADDPTGIAETVELLADAGAAGCSIEDWDPETEAIDDLDVAVARVAAAAAATRGAGLVLTARAEAHLHARPDLDATIVRLRAYTEAGADVLYAPGLTDIGEIRRLVGEVDRPVNVLAMPHGPTVPELAAAGVRRVSTGGALAFAAYGALAGAARELLGEGTYDYASGVLTTEERARAFGPSWTAVVTDDRAVLTGAVDLLEQLAGAPLAGEIVGSAEPTVVVLHAGVSDRGNRVRSPDSSPMRAGHPLTGVATRATPASMRTRPRI